MNLNDLKYESLSFAEELKATGNDIQNAKDTVLRMQVVQTGEAISSLYLGDHSSSLAVLENEERALKEAIYWIYMLYAAHAISMTVYEGLKKSATHLLELVSGMMKATDFQK